MSANLHMANVVAIFILAFVLTNVNAEYDVAKYCQLVKIGTKLPSFDSCKTYYICNGSKEFTKEECPDKQVFNKDDADCIPESQSNCKIGVTNPCEGKDQTFATDLENCRMWHWCVGGKSAGKGTCLTGQYFNGTACVNGKCVNENFGSKVGTVTEVKNVCNIMKIGMFFGDFGDCAKWLKCVANDTPPKGGRCDEKNVGFILDLQLQACTPFSKAACERTGGSVPVNPEVSCKNRETRPDEEVCSKYYLCNNEKWSHISCPNQQYFDIEKKKCLDRQEATPFKNCDRCEFSNDKWVNAVDSKCTKFLTCKDGHKVSEGSCGDDAYFNEQRQVCLTGVTSIKDYVDKNGACVCDWECGLKKCKNTDTACKDRVCNAVENKDNKVSCKFSACEDSECKQNACNSIYTEDNEDKDKIKCNIKACDDETCKVTYCNTLSSDPQKQTYCNLEKCQDHSCKDAVCNALPNTSLDEKVQCKIDACIDNNCKYDACDNYEEGSNNIWKCKHKICDGFIEAADKFNCKIKYCEDDDECKENACDTYTEMEKAKCYKKYICENDANNECKARKCEQVFEDDIPKRVECKLDICNNDETCKEDICKGITGNQQEKEECYIQKCKDIDCKNKVCKDNHEADKNGEKVCKFNICKDNDSCKTNVCNEVYETENDNENQLSCKIEICKADDIKCKHETCEKHYPPTEKVNIIDCKLDHCNDQDCKDKVCEGNAGEGTCPQTPPL